MHLPSNDLGQSVCLSTVATFGDPKHLPPNGLFVAFLEWASYLKNYLSTYGISFPFVPVHTIITTNHIQQKHKKFFDLFKRRKKQIYDLRIAPQTTPQKPIGFRFYTHPNLTHIVPMFQKKTKTVSGHCLRKLWSITTKQTMCETWQLQKVLGIAITGWR